MNNTCSASRSLGVINGFGLIYSQELDGVGEVGSNGCWYMFVTFIGFVDFIVMSHDDPLLYSFVGLQRAEAGLIK